MGVLYRGCPGKGVFWISADSAPNDELAPPLPVGFYAQPGVVTFSVAPESTVVQEGERVELTCTVAKQSMYTATTLPDPQIVWLVNGTVISEVTALHRLLRPSRFLTQYHISSSKNSEERTLPKNF
jgi:hypothetical protein